MKSQISHTHPKVPQKQNPSEFIELPAATFFGQKCKSKYVEKPEVQNHSRWCSDNLAVKESQRFNNRGKCKVKTGMQLCNLPGIIGLTVVIGGVHKYTLAHSTALGWINICWDCTLFQQCWIYSRCGGFTLCLWCNSSVEPNH